MTLGELAQRLNCSVVGNPEIEIAGLAPIEIAESSHLTFLSNKKYKKHLATTAAAAIILSDASDLPEGKSGLVSANPYLTFAEVMWIFYPPLQPSSGIHPSAIVAPTATIGENVTIGAFTTIGDGVKLGDNITILDHCSIYPNAEIGNDTLIHSHCVVREFCKIGRNVIFQNHVTVGSDGFGFAKRNDGGWFKIPQAGIVVIEDEVEIGAGSTIDRATIGATIIRKGTKLDNLVQIGHGSSVGEKTLLCAQVGLAGSSQIGNEVILSGQVGVAGHLIIGDKVIATAQTGIPNSVEAGKIISGYPAIDNRDWLKSSAVFAQLPKLQKEIRQLKEEINKLNALLER